MLQLLSAGEQTVSQLAAHFPVTRSAISQHLGVLGEYGLVESRQEGRFRYYRLVSSGVAALRAEMDSFWTAEFDRLLTDALSIADRPPTVGEA